jgi:hypothetical protein
MSQLGTDPIVQRLIMLGLPVTKANWLDQAFPDGMQGAEEFELIPPSRSSGSRSVPWFEKAARADHERRKKTSSETSRKR